MVIDLIDIELIHENLHLWREFKAVKEATLIHQGHIPHYAFVILEGSVAQLSRDKRETQLSQMKVHFSTELIHERPINKSVVIKPGARILIIDRYTLRSLL